MVHYKFLIQLVIACLIVVDYNYSYASDEKKNNILHEQLTSIQLQFNIPGLSYFIVDKQNIIASGSVGVMDRKSNKKFTLDSLIRIGSITKSFNALAFLKLVQLNKLSLDDNISQYIDDLPLLNKWSDKHPVKIAHLLEHTSGLLDLSHKEFAFNDGSIKSIKKAFNFEPENRVLQWPAGFYSSYSNVGAGYLAYIIEKVSSQSYESYIHESIFKPLNIQNASFFLDKTTKKFLTTGYDSDGEKIIPYWHMIFRAFGAINISSREMVAFVQLFLNKGRIDNTQFIASNHIERMEVPKTTLAARAGLQFGYGLANYAFIHKARVFHGHGGDGDGYLNYYAYNRDSGLGYFIVINAFKKRALYRMRKKIQDYIVADLKPVVQATVITHKNLSDFVGDYHAVTHRMPWTTLNTSKLSITLEKNNLYFQYGSVKKQLYPVSQTSFIFSGQPVATMAFTEHQKKMYFHDSDSSYVRSQKHKL